MSIAFLMIFAGFVLVYAGVTNTGVLEVARGNFDVPKKPVKTLPTAAG